MEKTPLQEISEKYIELSFDRFVEWFGRNRERLTTAERDAIVKAWDNSRKNEKALIDMTGEQYYETMYGSSFK